MPQVVVLDYGSGNLRSAQRALTRVGASVTVSSDVDLALACDGLVVPGVGAFAAVMQGIDAVRGREVIQQRAEAERPILGICVGMQILCSFGDEFGTRTAGVGVFDAEVEKLNAPVLPHMGWNTIAADPDSVLLDGADSDERFYFVHSFGVLADVADAAVSRTTHGQSTFAAIIERGEIRATQFHPEKSGDAGAELLERWVATL